MATSTFIPYIPPRPAAPAPRRETLRPPARHRLPLSPHGLPVPLGLPTGMPSGRSEQPAGSHSLGNRDGVEVVDLMDSHGEDPPPESQAAEDGQPRAEGERIT